MSAGPGAAAPRAAGRAHGADGCSPPAGRRAGGLPPGAAAQTPVPRHAAAPAAPVGPSGGNLTHLAGCRARRPVGAAPRAAGPTKQPAALRSSGPHAGLWSRAPAAASCAFSPQRPACSHPAAPPLLPRAPGVAVPRGCSPVALPRCHRPVPGGSVPTGAALPAGMGTCRGFLNKSESRQGLAWLFPSAWSPSCDGKPRGRAEGSLGCPVPPGTPSSGGPLTWEWGRRVLRSEV